MILHQHLRRHRHLFHLQSHHYILLRAVAVAVSDGEHHRCPSRQLVAISPLPHSGIAAAPPATQEYNDRCEAVFE